MIDLKRVVPITCHADPGEVFHSHLRGPWVWRPGHENKAYGGVEPWRTCGYCGCMHPLDLLGFIERDELQLESADWKYGWPHKFYARVKNPHAGKPSVSGSMSSPYRGETPEAIAAANPGYENFRLVGHRWEADAKATPAPSHMHGKFYNEHLVDLNDEEFAALSKALAVRVGVEFVRQDGKLGYRRVAS